MGREIRRVPVDFVWPLNKIWGGFINPNRGSRNCQDCKQTGLAPVAKRLYDQWYGYADFNPAMTGSTPYDENHPTIRAFASRNGSIEYYGGDPESAILREGKRLSKMFNQQWSHHLDANDVAALLEADRLWDFTRVPRTPEQKLLPKHPNGWLKESNGYVPTPEEVNTWGIGGFGHDSINAFTVVKAKARRMKVRYQCKSCEGTGEIWSSATAKAKYEAWKRQDPPVGEGWQMWETVTEGSPQTPVFITAEGLMFHLMHELGYTQRAAEAFVKQGWVASGLMVDGKMYKDIESAGV